jgi:hypothetical protein
MSEANQKPADKKNKPEPISADAPTLQIRAYSSLLPVRRFITVEPFQVWAALPAH